ncbi:hypothetical protein LTR85_007209 [Meristemomyces frigidus]|nr:hypothetical protein LTR85_007209 [Meristemomyces frigidus]
MSTSKYIKKVAIVGAGGNSGSYMAKELLKTGKHTVTAITRIDSTSKLPDGINIAKVDYNDPVTIVEALKGQDALIVTLGVFAPPDTQAKLVQAAANAGVPWVLPNEWSPDTTNEGLLKDIAPFQKLAEARELIKKLGKSSYIAVSTGFWYEWSLAIPAAFGFDFANRAVTFFDQGETKMGISTWPQIGRAVAALLSMPVKPEDGDSDRCLERFRNSQVYVNSFTVSQRDMLESVLRVTGTKESDWKITKELAVTRYTEGLAAMQKGDREGFGRVMYSRVFFADDSGDFEKTKGTANEMLGLPKEDIDEATRIAEERSKADPWH